MNTHFIPRLDENIDIHMYAKKIFNHGFRIEYFEDNNLCGLLACYINSENNFSFITTISVLPTFQKKGYAQILLDKLIEECKRIPTIYRIDLEVANSNTKALAFYRKNDFKENTQKKESKILTKIIKIQNEQ